MKAQQVKNAVIVPVGSKGGFYPKQLPPRTDPAWFETGRDAYKEFITALLGLTDNLVKGKVVAPKDTVVWDGEDPYLVVAADKGTATFSDTANAISIEKGHWLGDAFASGGSAGGTLSLVVGLAAGPDAADDDTSVSARPCALVLFNPAQGGAIDSRLQALSAEEKNRVVELLSAINHAQQGQPPAIFFFGTDDGLLEPSREFCRASLELGNRCELWTAEGEGHGFFNRPPWHETTLRKADEFLTSLGYLEGEPTIEAGPGAVLKQELPAAGQ